MELCSSLIEGGITPSARLIEMTPAAVSVALHVMIRPRAGDFCYDAEEFQIVDQTGTTEVHVGLRSAIPSPMLHRNPRVAMGSVEGREYQCFVVLEEQVRKLCRALMHEH